MNVQDFEYTFGEIACEIRIRQVPDQAGSGRPLYLAEAYKWEHDGKAVRAIVKSDGFAILAAGSDADIVRTQTEGYLEARLGSRGSDPVRKKGGDVSIRPILQPPLKEETQEG